MHSLSNKANLDWIKYGNENSTVFHNSIKQRRYHNHINMLMIDGKIISDPWSIRQSLLLYYSNLLYNRMENRARLNMQTIQAGPILSKEQWPLLDLNFSAAEIRNAIWSIDKSSGLAGFNSKFQMASWSVVGQDVINAIQTSMVNF